MNTEGSKTSGSRPFIMACFMSLLSDNLSNMIKRAQRVLICIMCSRTADWKSSQCGNSFGGLILDKI